MQSQINIWYYPHTIVQKFSAGRLGIALYIPFSSQNQCCFCVCIHTHTQTRWIKKKKKVCFQYTFLFLWSRLRDWQKEERNEFKNERIYRMWRTEPQNFMYRNSHPPSPIHRNKIHILKNILLIWFFIFIFILSIFSLKKREIKINIWTILSTSCLIRLS